MFTLSNAGELLVYHELPGVQIFEVFIYDIAGRLVVNMKTLSDHKAVIEGQAGKLRQGIYLVKANINNTPYFRKVLIK